MIQERESEVSVERGGWSVERGFAGTFGASNRYYRKIWWIQTDLSADLYRQISVDCCSCWLLQQRFSNRVLHKRYRYVV
jgi:hypothetical protein